MYYKDPERDFDGKEAEGKTRDLKQTIQWPKGKLAAIGKAKETSWVSPECSS